MPATTLVNVRDRHQTKLKEMVSSLKEDRDKEHVYTKLCQHGVVSKDTV